MGDQIQISELEYRNVLLEELWTFAREAGFLLPLEPARAKARRIFLTIDYQKVVDSLIFLSEHLPCIDEPASEKGDRRVRHTLDRCASDELRKVPESVYLALMQKAFNRVRLS